MGLVLLHSRLSSALLEQKSTTEQVGLLGLLPWFTDKLTGGLQAVVLLEDTNQRFLLVPQLSCDVGRVGVAAGQQLGAERRRLTRQTRLMRNRAVEMKNIHFNSVNMRRRTSVSAQEESLEVEDDVESEEP